MVIETHAPNLQDERNPQQTKGGTVVSDVSPGGTPSEKSRERGCVLLLTRGLRYLTRPLSHHRRSLNPYSYEDMGPVI